MFGRSKHGWIGLDIGASCIKLAQVVRLGDRLHLEEAAIVPRNAAWRDEELVESPAVSAADEIANALLTAPQASGRYTAAVLPTTACQLNTAPYVEAGGSAQIEAIVEELDTLGISLAERVFDCWPGLASKAGQGGLNILSTSRGWSECLTADIAQAGLSCQAIDGLPHALSRAVCEVHRSTAGTVAALDWSYTGATFVLIDQGHPVYVRQLKQCALADGIETVAEQLNLNHDEVTELLQTVNLAPQPGGALDQVSQVVAELLAPSFNHLAGEMLRTLEHVHNVGKNMTPKRLFLAPQSIYLFGGGATLGGIATLLAHRLRRQVKVWKLSDQAEAVARAKAVPLCLLGPAIALSALRWEAVE